MNDISIENAEHHVSKLFYGYVIVALAFVIMSIMWGAFYAFGVFFKPMLREFGWTRAMTAGAFSVCSFTQGLISIAMGGFTDRYGARIVMTMSGILLGLGYFLMSYVNHLWHFYLFYGFILGIGMGGSYTPLLSVVARWFKEKRGMMTGIVTAGIGIGAFVGPPVASRLISIYGWRVSYSIFGSILLVIVVLCAQFLKHKPDKPGLQSQNIEKEGLKKKKDEGRSLSFREAYHTLQFWVFFIMIVCLGFCVFAIMVHIVPHAIEVGINPINAANILATIGALSIAGKIFFGRLGDRIGSILVFIIAFTLLSASLFWLIPAESFRAFCLFAIVFGLAYGGAVTSESPLVAELFGLKNHGLILGIISFSFTFGGAIGPFLIGYMFDIAGSYRFAFLVCAIVSCFGLISALIIKRKGVISFSS
jgi:MFS family permease